MGERFSLHVTESTLAVLVGHERNRSGRLNQVTADYQTLIADNMPEFSVTDWQVLITALEHAPLSTLPGLRLAWAVLADDTDAAHLAERVRAMSVSQLLAMRELLRRWRNTQEGSAEGTSGAPDAGARLQDLGARIRE